jgi:hypothetical protein
MKSFCVLLLLIFLAALTPSKAKAEDGCPANQLPDQGKCFALSKWTRLPLRDDRPMVFEAVQVSPMIIWIQATGTITQDTPRAFRDFLKTDEAGFTKSLRLHSPGGNLAAGLELGRLIRQAGYNTSVGNSVPLQGDLGQVKERNNPACMSACAYAFLGGVTRSYSNDARYGVHRFGLQGGTVEGNAAQVVSSRIAAYIQQMGVDLSVFMLASDTSFERGMHFIPPALAEKMRIIYDPTGVTRFVIEEAQGGVVARFSLSMRDVAYTGAVSCASGVPALIIGKPGKSFPEALQTLKGWRAAFDSPVGELSAVTHHVQLPGTNPNVPHGIIVFEIPNLSPRAFVGNGLSLQTINNPNLGDSLKNRLLWFQTVTEFYFNIRADNAEQTLPIVLRECSRRR